MAEQSDLLSGQLTTKSGHLKELQRFARHLKDQLGHYVAPNEPAHTETEPSTY